MSNDGFAFGQRTFGVGLTANFSILDGPEIDLYADRLANVMNSDLVCPACQKSDDIAVLTTSHSHSTVGVGWCRCGCVMVWDGAEPMEVYEFDRPVDYGGCNGECKKSYPELDEDETYLSMRFEDEDYLSMSFEK